MVKQRRKFPHRPLIEIYLDAQWSPGVLAAATQHDDDAWTFQVEWTDDREGSRRHVDTFPMHLVRGHAVTVATAAPDVDLI